MSNICRIIYNFFSLKSLLKNLPQKLPWSFLVEVIRTMHKGAEPCSLPPALRCNATPAV